MGIIGVNSRLDSGSLSVDEDVENIAIQMIWKGNDWGFLFFWKKDFYYQEHNNAAYNTQPTKLLVFLPVFRVRMIEILHRIPKEVPANGHFL